MKDWNLLKDKEIIELIIGDIIIENNYIWELRMPYMTGKDICEFSSKIGLNQEYNDCNKLSRKEYMLNTLEYAILNKKINLFFKELFKLKRFRKMELPIEMSNIDQLYWETVHKFFFKINEILHFEDCHIEYDMQTFEFCLLDDKKEISLKSEKIQQVDSDYIKKLKEQIDKVIKIGDYESAITKSRTMIEEILVYGIEKKKEIPTEKGNINNLYSQFKGLYKMHQDKSMDKRVNNLLSGLEKIITSISQMRDKNSDSHGVGSKRIKIKEHHAVLFVNAAITMSNFLLAIIENEM